MLEKMDEVIALLNEIKTAQLNQQNRLDLMQSEIEKMAVDLRQVKDMIAIDVQQTHDYSLKDGEFEEHLQGENPTQLNPTKCILDLPVEIFRNHLFRYLSNIDIYNIGQTGNTKLQEISEACVQLGKVWQQNSKQVINKNINRFNFN